MSSERRGIDLSEVRKAYDKAVKEGNHEYRLGVPGRPPSGKRSAVVVASERLGLSSTHVRLLLKQLFQEEQK